MSLRYQGGINLPGYNPLKVANAPTIGTATSASGTSVSVAFTAPACVGGGAISSYTVFANCGLYTGSGASSPITVSGLTTGTAYTFKAVATNAYGPSYPSASSNSATPVAAGQQAYTTAGTFSWVAPTGVTSVAVVAVGGGGKGATDGARCCYPATGSGGGLGYKNNYTVVPGNSYTVVVGPGTSSTASTNNSYFVSTAVVKGGGGSAIFCFSTPPYSAPGTFTGDGGGNGGAGRYCSVFTGGGGAGGYAGNGGNGGITPTCGAGGGGGGAYNTNGFGGGGVGILGQGASGAKGTSCSKAGKGGSGGADGNVCGSIGGAYGGGGGSGNGGKGAVRIIWPGNTRSFPSTCTGNL